MAGAADGRFGCVAGVAQEAARRRVLEGLRVWPSAAPGELAAVCFGGV